MNLKNFLRTKVHYSAEHDNFSWLTWESTFTSLNKNQHFLIFLFSFSTISLSVKLRVRVWSSHYIVKHTRYIMCQNRMCQNKMCKTTWNNNAVVLQTFSVVINRNFNKSSQCNVTHLCLDPQNIYKFTLPETYTICEGD